MWTWTQFRTLLIENWAILTSFLSMFSEKYWFQICQSAQFLK